MIDLLLNTLFLSIAIALSILGAIFGAWFQQRNWRHQHREQLRQERRAAALTLVEDLSNLMDRRLYRQRRFIWALRSGHKERICRAITEYNEALFDWNDNYGRIKARLWSLFDRGEFLRFEDEIHNRFQKAGAIIEEVANKMVPISALAAQERELNRLGYQCQLMMKSLLERIAKERLAGLQDQLTVSHDNWDNLSDVFLIKRLFGLVK